MSTIDPGRELQRLKHLYSSQTDEQLLQIAQDNPSLTEIAQRALNDEIQRRKLIPPATTSIDEVEFREMVTIAKFRDLPEALLAQGNLNSSGIETVLLDDNLVRLDWLWSNAVGGIKLQVKAEDADEATELLNQPIPEMFEFGGAADYRQPECPKCKSRDVTFQEIYKPVAYGSLWVGIPLPVHRKAWKCRACGNEWEDNNLAESTES
jgi:hypothetical protein